ncbi:MAG: metallophosphoesterase family protein [Lachnospiraceae bacterium]|nr:metallophosphoesterase family protein [Lachnospiraceae bacterium]
MYAVLSDIHGNLYALESVIEDMKKYPVDGIILLGDLIDYGMQSNEVVEHIKEKLTDKVICNIWGNHEHAILTDDFSHFSSQRGVDSARYTKGQLSDKARDFLEKMLIHEGEAELEIGGKRVLAVHASLEDPYWKAIAPDNVRGDYSKYDLVLSGHSHLSHFFTKFYDSDDPKRRNRHVVHFLNPGSVGQPRDHDPNAKYALIDIDTGSVLFRSVPYDIEAAMSLFDGSVDDFYRERLEFGV